MKGSCSSNSGGDVGAVGRSVSEKEKTKIRERQRRGITTKILSGLRKHGGYNLPPRADINDVLRQLAKEAGWIVEPDGTTYRSSSTTTTAATTFGGSSSGKRSCTSTPVDSSIGGGAMGDCSTTNSPRHITCGLITQNHRLPYHQQQEGYSFYLGGMPYLGSDQYNQYQYHHHRHHINYNNSHNSMTALTQQQHQQLEQLAYFNDEEEAGASNQHTPILSPHHTP